MKKTLMISVMLCACALSGASLGLKVYGKACVECHGDEGKESSISGKPIAGAGDILKKLQGYKAGTFGGAQKETMQASLAPLSDDEIQAVAEYVEKF